MIFLVRFKGFRMGCEWDFMVLNGIWIHQLIGWYISNTSMWMKGNSWGRYLMGKFSHGCSMFFPACSSAKVKLFPRPMEPSRTVPTRKWTTMWRQIWLAPLFESPGVTILGWVRTPCYCWLMMIAQKHIGCYHWPSFAIQQAARLQTSRPRVWNPTVTAARSTIVTMCSLGNLNLTTGQWGCWATVEVHDNHGSKQDRLVVHEKWGRSLYRWVRTNQHTWGILRS